MTYELPSGVNVWIPGTDLKLCLEEAVKMWITENPVEVNQFAQQIKDKRAGLHRIDGMTEQGTMKEYLEVPIKLAQKIQQMTHKDWTMDRKITDLVKQLIPHLAPYQARNESSVAFSHNLDLGGDE